MNSLSTLYFPGTDIYSIRQYPLFLLFQKLHLLKPVEEGPGGSGQESIDSFINSGFCQVHTPCPLGDHRTRFLRLVEDIRNRKDDYAAQLSSLILAGKTGQSAGEEDSERSIQSALINPDAVQNKAHSSEKEDKLWQARLVLAIGEIFDREEEDIAHDLAMLDNDQTELFKILHGDVDESEEDSPLAELEQVKHNLSGISSGNIKKRFDSWKRLFVEGELPDFPVFLTSSPDAGDLLLDIYERQTGRPADLVANLQLPALIGWSEEEAYNEVVRFCAQCEDLLNRIHIAFADLQQKRSFAEGNLRQDSAFSAISEHWTQKLVDHFPTHRFGRIPLRCYLFQGLDCATLIGKISPENDQQKNGILIVAG